MSVIANLAEGFDRGTHWEFLRYVQIARGSCAEVRSHLYGARSAGLIGAGDFGRLWARADEIGKITHGLRSALAKRLAAGDISALRPLPWRSVAWRRRPGVD